MVLINLTDKVFYGRIKILINYKELLWNGCHRLKFYHHIPKNVNFHFFFFKFILKNPYRLPP